MASKAGGLGSPEGDGQLAPAAAVGVGAGHVVLQRLLPAPGRRQAAQQGEGTLCYARGAYVA